MDRILAMDISGNFHEGKGTTGLCLLEDGNPLWLGEIKASNHKTQEEYWEEHSLRVKILQPEFLVIEGYKLYNHKGKEAKMQANSNLETPQLLGYLKMVAYENHIPLKIQYASDVKSRWSEDVLVRTGYLEERNNRYYFLGNMTSTHKRDALKHALHFERYGKDKMK